MNTIKPIRSEAQYEEAMILLDELWDAPEGSEQADTLEVLSLLIEDYEEKHHPIPPPDPIEAIKFRMEQEGLSRKDLEAVLGASRGRVSEILGRR